MRVSAFVRLILIVVGVFLTTSVRAADFGPLQLKNRFPFHLLFLTPRPLPSQVPSQGDLDAVLAADYSVVYFNHANRSWNFLMDMEMTTVDLSLTYGLMPGLALKAELPFVSMNAGFLDRFLEGYHDVLGVANYGREERPDNTFAYRISHDRKVWIEGESGRFEAADMTLAVQWQMFPERPQKNNWTGSFLFSLKVPSGDADKGMGSGQFDYGFFLNAAYLGDPWSYYLMAGAALHNDPDTRGGWSEDGRKVKVEFVNVDIAVSVET